MSRILGIDYGKARIGLAISDETETLARALKVAHGLDNLKKEVKIIVDLYNIKTIVLGLSKKYDGTLGEIGELVEIFSHYLKEAYPEIEIDFYDESLSTKQVEQYFREMGMSLKKYKKEIDKYAAEVILQRYLNFKGEKKWKKV